MSPNFERILDDCIARMRAGQDLEECLRAYPSQADQLRPLLSVTAKLQHMNVPQERPEAVSAGRERLLEAQANLLQGRSTSTANRSGKFKPSFAQFMAFLRVIFFGKDGRRATFALRLGLSVTMVLLIAAVMTLNVSAKSIPGDPLYGIKRTWENTKLLLTSSPEAREQLENEYTHNRYEELKELVQIHRAATLDFQARIDRIDPNKWIIGHFTVLVDGNTSIEGQPETGKLVHVRAQLRDDGTVLATLIQVVQPEETIGEPTEPTNSPVSTSEPEDLPVMTQDANPSGNYSTPTPTSGSEDDGGNPGGKAPTATTVPTDPAEVTATSKPTDTDLETPEAAPQPSSTPQFSPTPGPSDSTPTGTATLDSSPTPSATPTRVKEYDHAPVPSTTKPSPTPTPTPTPKRDD